MPIKTITAPGDSKGVNLLKTNTNYNTAHDATAAASVNTDHKFTLHAKAGSNYLIRRGILLYDFRGSVLPANIKVLRAQLIVNDVSELAPQTGGDKVRVAWLFNPNTFGDTHANDYNKARYQASTYTSAQQINNGSSGEVIRLDNRRLLNQLQKAINTKTYLHLVIRNELDYQDTTATGNNRAWFDNLDDDNPAQLRIFYQAIPNRRFVGTGGGRRASRSGFSAGHVSAGTSAGFS
tara:strand:+ start:41 stop:748 length:708 start_codon:yes stop_codon:yes gene_type:complete